MGICEIFRIGAKAAVPAATLSAELAGSALKRAQIYN